MNQIKAIKFLGWYFLRIAIGDYDKNKPLQFEGSISTTDGENLENEVHDGLSVLECSVELSDTINAQTAILKSDLSAMMIDGRGSYIAPGATVFDQSGRLGIIDIVDGNDVVITTCLPRQVQIETKNGVKIERNGKTIKMWGRASIGSLGPGVATHIPVAFPDGIVLANADYFVNCTTSCDANFAQTMCDYDDPTTTGFSIGARNVHTATTSTNIIIDWSVVGDLA